MKEYTLHFFFRDKTIVKNFLFDIRKKQIEKLNKKPNKHKTNKSFFLLWISQ